MTTCGCNQTPPDKDYLLVEASASDPNQCGNPTNASSTADCAKQEPMFDESLSDFLVPSSESSVPMTVCNATVYVVGSWIQFIGIEAKLQISAINGRDLTLLNRNKNGVEVSGNPSIGTKISKYTKFVVCDGPNDLTDAEERDKINDALAGAIQLCMPALASSSATAIVQPVGRVESDPENLSVGKCLRRIYGILFKAGRPVLNALGTTVDINDMTDFRPLVKHKTNNEVRQRKNYSEASGLGTGKQYGLAITSSSEKLLGPIYFTKVIHEPIEESDSSLTPASWSTMTDEYTKDFDMESIGTIPPLEHNLDHYYVWVNLEIAGNKTSGSIQTMRAYMNDIIVGRCSISGDADSLNFNSISKLVRVKKSDHKLTLKLVANGSIRYYYRLNVEAVLF